MRYGSVCSGIEAATMAWHGLGWSPAFFSEIEKFPCAVLAHHYGSNMPGDPPPDNGVPNRGDMSQFREWPDHDGDDAIDLLVGGTPCQSSSVAGLRKGLDDPRGNLMLTYLAIARRYQPRWLVWENVPGVLSSNGGRDFGALIRGLEELGYHAAWRVLDAQYVRTQPFPRAVPQRRRRVFVVGYLGDWRRAAAVLFDGESLRGDPPPRREAGEGVAPTISARPSGGGGLGTDFDLDGGLVAASLDASFGRLQGCSGQDLNHGHSHLVAHALRAEGFDASEDGTGRGTPIVPVLTCKECGESFTDPHGEDIGGLAPFECPRCGEETRLVRQPVAFDCKGTQVQYSDDGAAPTLRSMGHNDSGQNAGGHAAVAIQERAVSENPEAGPQGKGFQEGVAYTLEARSKVQAVATQWAVRRLTPRECERLQGFPDDFTAIPWRGKGTEKCPDGPRYKALGNSMAVNVMQWIGERIQMVEDMSVDGEGLV